MNRYILRCTVCQKTYPLLDIRYRCTCGEALQVENTPHHIKKPSLRKLFDNRKHSDIFLDRSGVWRYRQLLIPIPKESIVTRQEGNTLFVNVGRNVSGGFSRIGEYCNLPALYLKHEGDNPTGSFKDRGMTVGISIAKYLGMKEVACASTGNTSASLASYAAQAGLKCTVYIPEGKVALGKLAQSLAYGAKIQKVKEDFDLAMRMVEDDAIKKGVYLLNSLNPFRIEGQKTIAFEILQDLGWKSPDWIVLPAGNLGNTSALGKGLLEMYELGIINRIPRIASIQAEGANPFYKSYKMDFKKQFSVKAETVASAIRIGNPVSYQRAKNVIVQTKGVVEEVSDKEILEAKLQIDSAGIGCEPASAASVAGIKKLVQKKVITHNSIAVGILTGALLKDPEAILSQHSK